MADEDHQNISVVSAEKSAKSSLTDDVANAQNAEETTEDKELDDLLDSALEDFDKPPPSACDTTDPKKEPGKSDSNLPLTGPSLQAPELPKETKSTTENEELSSQQEAMFNDLFKAAGSEEGQGQADFEQMMRQFMSQQPELMQQFDQIPQTTDFGVPPESSGNFAETLQQTLGSLAQNTQSLQNDLPEGDLMQMLSGLGLEEGEGGDAGEMDFMPMMQGMMKSLMSKEVLYPSLKEIAEKYPAWLEENSTKVSSKDLTNYKKQYEYMRTIVTEFENEKAEDSEDVKKRRFNKILDIMQSMQELGHPPKELVGDMPAGMDFDENGLPKMLPNPEQCSVM